MQFVWVRAGDGDDYHRFDDVNGAADYMAGLDVRFVGRHCKFGVQAEGFTGHNYISLFYGDADAQPLDHKADLSDGDLRFLNDRLYSSTRR